MDNTSEEEKERNPRKKRTPKDRCDGNDPCNKCSEKNLPCSFERLRIGPGPRRGWLEQLKSRFIAVEASLMSAMNEAMDVISPEGGGNFQRPGIPDRTGAKPRDVVDGVLRNLETTVESFREEMRRLSFHGVPAPSVSCSGNLAAAGSPFFDLTMPHKPHDAEFMSDVDLLLQSTSDFHLPLSQEAALLGDGVPVPEEALPILRPVGIFDDLDPLPSPEIVNAFVSRFFRYNWDYRFVRTINPIHRPTFLANFSKQQPLLVYSVMAVAATSSEENVIANRRLGNALFSRCKRILEELGNEIPDDISFVQALILLCQYASGQDRGTPSVLLALAVRKARENNLFVDPSLRPDRVIQEIPGSADWIAEEQQRRTGWALFGADRIGAFIHTRAPLISDVELQLQPLASDEIWEANPMPWSTSRTLRNPFASPVASISPLEPFYIIGQAQALRADRDWSKDHPGTRDLEGLLSAWYEMFVETYPAAKRSPFSPEFSPEYAPIAMSSLKSFVSYSQDSDFPIQNIPFGIISTTDKPAPRAATIVGDYVVDLQEVAAAGLFDGKELRVVGKEVFSKPTLNAFMELGKPAWREARSTLQQIFGAKDMHPNTQDLPIAYHGRSSTIQVSGSGVKRPMGLFRKKGEQTTSFAPTNMLDMELELGYIVGVGSRGERISPAKAEEHYFGVVLLNDWSARDIQGWESVPLGPFNGKSFATSISPWVVTLDALSVFSIEPPSKAINPAPYLRDSSYSKSSTGWYDINLEVDLIPSGLSTPSTITRTNAKHLYWNGRHMLAHQTVGGCLIRTGDLLGTGTITAGEALQECGCFCEMTSLGSKPLAIGDTGLVRKFLEDGDEIVFRGHAQGDGFRIGFGECRGTILSADPWMEA
ncbi:hypothetical protein HDU93_003983 [Gonapodya sp. JEL0774]|nr:hypothetical protein HDU93_003983 [Gonapodya sp. JEL0774]